MLNKARYRQGYGAAKQRRKAVKGIPKKRRLTREEECELVRRFQEKGDVEAMRELILTNLHLLRRLVESYMNARLTNCNAAFFDDLFQEGVMGMFRALQDFDTKRGTRFMTYAGFWIRHFFQQCPGEWLCKFIIPVGYSREYMRLSRVPMDEASWEQVESPEDLPEERVGRRLDAEAVRAQLKNLDPREQKILEWHYGLGDDEPRSLTDIGKVFGLSCEGVRLIEVKALKKLRHLMTEPPRQAKRGARSEMRLAS